MADKENLTHSRKKQKIDRGWWQEGEVAGEGKKMGVAGRSWKKGKNGAKRKGMTRGKEKRMLKGSREKRNETKPTNRATLEPRERLWRKKEAGEKRRKTHKFLRKIVIPA